MGLVPGTPGNVVHVHDRGYDHTMTIANVPTQPATTSAGSGMAQSSNIGSITTPPADGWNGPADDHTGHYSNIGFPLSPTSYR